MTTTITAPARERTTKKTSTGYLIWLTAASLVCVAIAVFATSAYVTLDMTQSRPSLRGPLHYGLLVTHIATGTIALLGGLAQFVPWLRTRYPVVHRWTGRGYLFAGVLPSSVLGLAVALLSLGGLASQVPLSLLSVLWFVTAVQGLRAARARNFREHRVWMIRNFALTTAAVTGRLWGLALSSALPDAGGAEIFAAANWLSFTVNLLVAEWWIQRRRSVTG